MFPRDVSQNSGIPKGLRRYLGPNEVPVHCTQRHIVVLSKAIAIWLLGTVLGVVLLVASRGEGGGPLASPGAFVLLVSFGYMAGKLMEWKTTRFVFTPRQVLFVEGIAHRKVNAVPFRVVLDITLRQTSMARAFRYCDLELNVSGQPGLRRLERLPNPDFVYQLIQSLISPQHPPQAPPSGIRRVQ